MTKLVFDNLEAIKQTFKVLELIPDTHAWVKDIDGRFIGGNSLFYQRFGFSSEQGLMNKTDFDLAPSDLAQRYRQDDKQVLAGNVMTDRLELIGGSGNVQWFLTSKWPIYDLTGKIIGSFGMSRHLNREESKAIPYQELSAPINYIRQHFGERISVKALADACNLSVSALERRFRKHLDKTPHQYLTEVRLDQGLRLLQETDKSVGTIALETGFTDHSHFTRAFRRYFGGAPSSAR